MNKCIQKTEIPEWITKGEMTLIQKTSEEQLPKIIDP